MSDLESALRELAQLFDAVGVPYAAMGGIAVRVYGIPRPTYDLVFTIAVDRDRLNELYAAIETLGYTVPDEYHRGWVDEIAGMPLVKVRLYVKDRGLDVDLFLAESPFQHSLLARRRQDDINALTIWLVSPEDLILLKLLAGRPRDLADIGDILFMQGKLDEVYMREWGSRLGVLQALDKALAGSSED